MPRVEVNGVELFYEERSGDGDPLVLVHGSWGDHNNWAPVLPALTERFRVLVYDRRGHSRSERPPGQGSRFEDEEDLAALMETLGFAPAYVAGNSFGASTALGLASRRPELFRGLVAHEPPLMGVVADDTQLLPLMAATGERIEGVLAHLRAGETLAGARQFVEEVALGPGAWDQLPDQLRQTFLTNAPTFLDEQADPDWANLGLGRLPGYTGPALLTKGTKSPPWFAEIIARLSGALPQARTHTFEGAGHIPHVTHPDDYARLVTDFIEKHRQPS
ncbi:alpha/beta hydrolase [Streptomyces sp. ADMS]|uniref:alpha/beta fold hydrolase n=1 Tax=Streptomyces sp. ADMS TaxID=3071415 RepID=UPI00296FB0D8|nr:alpha/beta hydrolase [Streptomyces sp. ADMS]MDW4909705.1 alpha/beta hydrolase [Streptomyces sp. ADMS]